MICLFYMRCNSFRRLGKDPLLDKRTNGRVEGKVFFWRERIGDLQFCEDLMSNAKKSSILSVSDVLKHGR